MLWIHPVLQLWATLMAFYVLFLGLQRFRVLHLNHKAKFEWRKHVFWGRIVIIVWLAGLVLGRFATHNQWGEGGIFLSHVQGAMFMTPLMIIAYFTGSIMDRQKKKRKWLPALHGLNNLVMSGLALYQFYTGYFIIQNFIL
ncbi:DUF4079 family protein [Desulfonatronovibrio magnus]|uniref:DUF4079 family protein n=1 Tax=Desulfonatronovibrio magnus TaxID=698827 RepID=UPI0005EB725E|nr:DUF4079 family protein [Desulfonatronovibrio magnus]